MFTALFVVIEAGSALGLILLILMHSGKGGGLSDMFGGSMGAAAQGSTVVERNLDRITVVLALDLRVRDAHPRPAACSDRAPVRRRLAAGADLALVLAAPRRRSLGRRPSPCRSTATLDVAIPGPFAGCDPARPAPRPATDAVLGLVLPRRSRPGPLDVAGGGHDGHRPGRGRQREPPGRGLHDRHGGAPGRTARRSPPRTSCGPGASVAPTASSRDLGYRDVASVRPTATGSGGRRSPSRTPTRTGSRCSTSSCRRRRPRRGARCRARRSTLDRPLRGRLGEHARGSCFGPTRPGRGRHPPTRRVDVTTDPAASRRRRAPPRASTYLPVPDARRAPGDHLDGRLRRRSVQHDTTIVSLDFAVRGPAALAPAVRGALARFVDRAVARRAARRARSTTPPPRRSRTSSARARSTTSGPIRRAGQRHARRPRLPAPGRRAPPPTATGA